MRIVKERTRILMYDYNEIEKRKIEDLVATMDKVFTYEDTDNHFIALPTGMHDPIKKLFPNNPIEDKSQTYWEYETIQEYKFDIEPRNQLQKDCIGLIMKDFQKHINCAAIVSPGTGKTFMACYCALKTRAKTLIVVPTRGIKVQWAETLTGMFKVPEEKVKMINSPKEFINVKADFVVVSQATLAILNKTYDLQKILKANKFGIKIIDEVQMWFHNIVKIDGNSNIANNLYLTGTFGRSSDEENDIYQQMFGYIDMFTEKDKKPTIFNRKPGNVYGMKPHVHCDMIWFNSGLTDEEVRKCTNSMRYSERSGKWMRYGISIPMYTKFVIPSDGRMTKFLKTLLEVVKISEKTCTYGKTLILTPTIESVNIIAGHIEEMLPNKKIGTYNSTNSPAENERNKSECDILVSTVKSCGTGFDVKDLSKLIVAEQFKSWVISVQVFGRLRRRPDGRDTYMWDLADNRIKQLRVWANGRADIYKKNSKIFKVVDM